MYREGNERANPVFMVKLSSTHGSRLSPLPLGSLTIRPFFASGYARRLLRSSSTLKTPGIRQDSFREAKLLCILWNKELIIKLRSYRILVKAAKIQSPALLKQWWTR